MGITAITSAIDKSQLGEEAICIKKIDPSYVPNLSTMLVNMLQYEIDSRLVSLTRLKGVGGKTAKRFSAFGYTSLQSIADANPEVLSKIPGMGKKQADAVVKQAKELLASDGEYVYEEAPYDSVIDSRSIITIIDPYRLRRSLELSIKGSEGSKYIVVGGRDDHVVFVKDGQFTCDCMDYEKNGGSCKHILCVKRSLNDPEICRMVKRIKEDRNHSIRESLPSLWYAATEKGRGS